MLARRRALVSITGPSNARTTLGHPPSGRMRLSHAISWRSWPKPPATDYAFPAEMLMMPRALYLRTSSLGRDRWRLMPMRNKFRKSIAWTARTAKTWLRPSGFVPVRLSRARTGRVAPAGQTGSKYFDLRQPQQGAVFQRQLRLKPVRLARGSK